MKEAGIDISNQTSDTLIFQRVRDEIGDRLKQFAVTGE
ncbi:Hypothetical protein ACI5QM_00563 [Bacillus subtilis]